MKKLKLLTLYELSSIDRELACYIIDLEFYELRKKKKNLF